MCLKTFATHNATRHHLQLGINIYEDNQRNGLTFNCPYNSTKCAKAKTPLRNSTLVKQNANKQRQNVPTTSKIPDVKIKQKLNGQKVKSNGKSIKPKTNVTKSKN